MKKLTYASFIFIALLLLGIFYFLYYNIFSDQALTGKSNLKNIKRVEIGMDTNNVLKIMGAPGNKWKFKENIYYNYELPDGVSGNLTISFDTLGKVIDKGNFLE